MDSTNKNLLPPPTITFSQPPISSSTTTASSASSQQPSDPQTSAWRSLLQDTQRKLKESTTTQPSIMNPYNPQGGSGQNGSGSGGKGNDPGVLNGLLPRIETRGSGRGGSSTKDDKGKGGGSSR